MSSSVNEAEATERIYLKRGCEEARLGQGTQRHPGRTALRRLLATGAPLLAGPEPEPTRSTSQLSPREDPALFRI